MCEQTSERVKESSHMQFFFYQQFVSAVPFRQEHFDSKHLCCHKQSVTTTKPNIDDFSSLTISQQNHLQHELWSKAIYQCVHVTM